MFVESDSANKLDSTQVAPSARTFSAKIIEERATLRVLTRNCFQSAKRFSGKSAATIYANFKGLENIEQLGDDGKKRATRYAAGKAGMRACELEAFIEKCRAAGLLPADYVDPRLLSCGLTLGRKISDAVQARAVARAQFDDKRAALLRSLNEYSRAIERADELGMLVIDNGSSDPTHGTDDGVLILDVAHASRVMKIADEIAEHHMPLETDFR